MVNALAPVLAGRPKILRLAPTHRRKHPGLVAHLAQASSGDLAAAGRLAVAADSLAAARDRRPPDPPVRKRDRSGIHLRRGAVQGREVGSNSPQLAEARKASVHVQGKEGRLAGKPVPGAGAAARAARAGSSRAANPGVPGEEPQISRDKRPRRPPRQENPRGHHRARFPIR
jgi:hypothetical protein